MYKFATYVLYNNSSQHGLLQHTIAESDVWAWSKQHLQVMPDVENYVGIAWMSN